jgi:hypothetical protein
MYHKHYKCLKHTSFVINLAFLAATVGLLFFLSLLDPFWDARFTFFWPSLIVTSCPISELESETQNRSQHLHPGCDLSKQNNRALVWLGAEWLKCPHQDHGT